MFARLIVEGQGAVKQMNRALEFHDSTLLGVEKRGADVVLTFSPAYIHESSGTPGTDAGTGHLQDLEIRIQDGSITTKTPETPVEIYDGVIVVGDDSYSNVVSLLVNAEGGSINLEITTCASQVLSVQGNGIIFVPIGSSVYLEDFSGS